MSELTKRIALTALVAGSLLAGCRTLDGTYDSRVEEHLGEAQRETSAAQIADPRAGEKSPAPTGLDPVSGELARENYQHQRRRENRGEQMRSLVVPLD
jgi:hypothetical protein